MTRAARIYLRLELADALRSKWLLFASGTYLTLGAAFVWLGLHESSVLGFTGLSRVLLNLAHTVILVFPLIVLMGSHAAVVRGKSSGFCELMLSQPAGRGSWLAALLGARVAVLVGPLLALLAATGIAAASGFGEPELLRTAAASLSVCAALVFSFVGLGLAISAFARSAERAVVAALITFGLSAALLDMLLVTALLRTSLPPQWVFALAALNPSETARVAILASADPELSVLGPVGFWLAHSLGPHRALLLGIVYPAALGLVASVAAWWKLLRSDLTA